MRSSILAVLGIFVVYRLLTHIPIPLTETSQLKQLVEGLLQNQQNLGFLNIISGGALASFSIMILGLGPYINASIIMQILSKVIPKLEERQKEGEHARRKINQYTRILSVPLAAAQSIGVITLLRQQSVASSLGIDISKNASSSQWLIMVVALTAGSVLLMWLGEIITEKGIGNGISLVIFAGVASRLPSTAVSLWNTVRGEAADHIQVLGATLPISANGAFIVSIVLFFMVYMTYWVFKLNEAQRTLTIHYAKRVRGSREYGGITTDLPLKIIVAGVIPIIFAYAILSGLQMLGNVLQNVSSETFSAVGRNFVAWFTGGNGASQTGNIYIAVYFGLIFFFTYFYTRFVFDPHEISEQLQQQGGFIEGVKPGGDTERYLNRTMQRLNLTGALSIGILASIPLYAERYVNSNVLSFGGTSLLITVSVAIETLRQIRSKALMYTYDIQDAELEKSINNTNGDRSSLGLVRKVFKIPKSVRLNKKRSVLDNDSIKKSSKLKKSLQKKSK